MSRWDKETWTLSESHGHVTSDNPEGNWSDDLNTGHYGGYLVCESVRSKEVGKAIAAVPNLIRACEAARLAFRAIGIRDKNYTHELNLLNEALAKATG